MLWPLFTLQVGIEISRERIPQCHVSPNVFQDLLFLFFCMDTLRLHYTTHVIFVLFDGAFNNPKGVSQYSDGC